MRRKIMSKYYDHKHNASKRNVDFLLTFDEWWKIWQDSGHWEDRGPHKGQYCMSRYGDIGPYSPTNVFIQLTSNNTSDAQNGIPDLIRQGIPRTTKEKAAISLATKGKSKSIIACPHCNLSGGSQNMKRYHFDKCKRKGPKPLVIDLIPN